MSNCICLVWGFLLQGFSNSVHSVTCTFIRWLSIKMLELEFQFIFPGGLPRDVWIRIASPCCNASLLCRVWWVHNNYRDSGHWHGTLSLSLKRFSYLLSIRYQFTPLSPAAKLQVISEERLPKKPYRICKIHSGIRSLGRQPLTVLRRRPTAERVCAGPRSSVWSGNNPVWQCHWPDQWYYGPLCRPREPCLVLHV